MDDIVANSQNVWTIAITWGMVQCLVLPVLLVAMRRKRNKQILFLSLLSVVFGIQIFSFLFAYFEWYARYPSMIWSTAPLWLLTGPLLYFFERYATTASFRLRPIHVLHFVPLLAAVLFMKDFLLLDGTTKLSYFIDHYSNYSDNLSSKPNYFTYAYLVSNVVYGGVTLRNFNNYFKHVGREYSSDFVYRERWLLVIFSGFLLYWVLALVHFLLMQVDFSTYAGFTYVTYVFLIVFTQLVGYPALLFNDTFFVTPVSGIDPAQPDVGTTPTSGKATRETEVSVEDLQDELGTVLRYMEEAKPYLDPALRITDLGRMVDTPAHRLSFLINRALDRNFYEFVNEYRIEEVKRKLPSPHYKHLTLDAIAKECGFNSSASFYRVFKQKTGMTPRQYVDSLR